MNRLLLLLLMLSGEARSITGIICRPTIVGAIARFATSNACQPSMVSGWLLT